jgi:hypothetical protein
MATIPGAGRTARPGRPASTVPRPWSLDQACEDLPLVIHPVRFARVGCQRLLRGPVAVGVTGRLPLLGEIRSLTGKGKARDLVDESPQLLPVIYTPPCGEKRRRRRKVPRQVCLLN